MDAGPRIDAAVRVAESEQPDLAAKAQALEAALAELEGVVAVQP